MDLPTILATFGYAAVLVGTILEGEVVLVLAGFAAHEGHLNLALVIVVAVIGGFTGDQICFTLGRQNGRRFVDRRPHWKASSDRVTGWIERFPNLLAFGSRFIYGFRIVLPILIGTTRIKTIRFVLLNLTGAIVWAVLVGGAGYLFGQGVELVIHRIEHYQRIALAVAGVIAVVAWFVVRRLRRKARDRAARALAESAVAVTPEA